MNTHLQTKTLKKTALALCLLAIGLLSSLGARAQCVTTLAGTTGSSGSTDGTGSAARFTNPNGVAMDASGNVYVADWNNHTIRKITPAGVVTTLAGTAGSSGSTDGTGSAARFNRPFGVVLDASGNMYVAEQSNHTIRKITPTGVVVASTTTLAGTAGSTGTTDGTGSAARFNNPRGVATDASGNVYVADYLNHTIRKITSAGVVTTLAGTAGSSGSTDATGSAARFNGPGGVALDASGNVYVTDNNNHTIRKITPAGVVTTLAGRAGSRGSTDATGNAARFDNPNGVATDASGNVYVADYLNHTIRKITSAGVVTTLAGTAGSSGSTDATGSAARFNGPGGVALDASGNVYVTDNNNHTIRKITPAGVVTTLAGRAGSRGSTDATGNAARFDNPNGVATDASGNVYVADYNNHTIRKITSAGVVTTLAGTAGSSGSTDATGSAARFYRPTGVATDASGNVYVADLSNHTIRKITLNTICCTGTASLPTTADSTYTAAVKQTDAGGWTHYCAVGGELLLSLKIGTNGAVVAADEVKLKLGAKTTWGYLGADGGMVSTSNKGYQMMDRMWDVDPTTQPGSGKVVGVRYYFTADEYDDLKDSLLLHGPNQNAANKSTLSAATDISLYKATSGTAFSRPHTVNGIVIENGSTPSTTVWKHSTHGTADHIAEFEVSSFSGGGGGGGGGGGINPVPLPVELIHFTAKAVSSTSAKLNWATASGINNSYFEIERSFDGRTFETLGNVEGYGTSYQVNVYEYVDATVPLGTEVAFYRLKQVDYNGTTDYSEVRKVLFSEVSLDVVDVFPNPFTGSLYISVDEGLEQQALVRVVDIKGSVHKELTLEPNTNLQRIDLSELTSGIYFISILSDNQTKHIRVVKN